MTNPAPTHPRSPFLTQEGPGETETSYHLVLQGPFEPKSSLT